MLRAGAGHAVKEKTLALLVRVQALREKAGRRGVAEASAREAAAAAETARLAEEQRGVLSRYASGAVGVDLLLEEHATRYAAVLWEGERLSEVERARLDEELGEARRRLVKSLAKSDVLARKQREARRGGA